MQHLTVGKVIKDSSCPGRSFGAAAHHTDRKNLYIHAWDAVLGLRNGKVMELFEHCKLGTTKREMGTARPKPF